MDILEEAKAHKFHNQKDAWIVIRLMDQVERLRRSAALLDQLLVAQDKLQTLTDAARYDQRQRAKAYEGR